MYERKRIDEKAAKFEHDAELYENEQIEIAVACYNPKFPRRWLSKYGALGVTVGRRREELKDHYEWRKLYIDICREATRAVELKNKSLRCNDF